MLESKITRKIKEQLIEIEQLHQRILPQRLPYTGNKLPKFEKGKYFVSVGLYDRGQSVMAQQEVDRLKKQYPSIGAGKVLDSQNKVWIVYLGYYYSKESASLLREIARNELGFRDALSFETNGPEQTPLTLSEFFKQFNPQEDSHLVVVQAFLRENDAQKRVDKINGKFPELEAKKYRTKNGYWRVYIGDSYSRESAEKLQRYVLVKGIVENAYVKDKKEMEKDSTIDHILKFLNPGESDRIAADK